MPMPGGAPTTMGTPVIKREEPTTDLEAPRNVPKHLRVGGTALLRGMETSLSMGTSNLKGTPTTDEVGLRDSLPTT